MSDTSQGPGWWLASDGKWYPPQPGPTATPPTEVVEGAGQVQGTPAAPGADSSQGPGWWQASDDKWYPPQPGAMAMQPAAVQPATPVTGTSAAPGADSSPGPGWWLASDGKWYPPQPDPIAAQPEVIHAAAPIAGSPIPAGAVNSQGPGWWRATDGLWYPPQGTIIVQEALTKKFYRRVWFWLLVVLVVLFGGCIAIVAGGSNAINNADHVQHTIVYTVTGNGTADINYFSFSNGNSGSASVNGANLPWTKTFTASGIFSGYDVSAIGDTATSLTCSITIDGKQVAHNTGTGQDANVDCNGTNP